MHYCPICGEACSCCGDIDDIDTGPDYLGDCQCDCDEDDEQLTYHTLVAARCARCGGQTNAAGACERIGCIETDTKIEGAIRAYEDALRKQ